MLDSSSQLAKSTKPKEARTPFCLSWSVFPICSRSNPLGQMLMFCTLDTEVEGGLDLSRIIPWGVYSELVLASNSSLLSLVPCLLHTPVTQAFSLQSPEALSTILTSVLNIQMSYYALLSGLRRMMRVPCIPPLVGVAQFLSHLSSPASEIPSGLPVFFSPTKSKDVFIILLTTKNMCGVGCEPGWPRSPV